MKPLDPNYRNLSCQYLTEALFRLMERKNYNDITVTEITKEAGIARRTFYLNYTSKDDILDQHYNTLLREYDAGSSEELLTDGKAQGVYFFSFWSRHRDYINVLAKNRMMYTMMGRFQLYMDDMMNRLSGGHSGVEENYTASFIAGGLWMMLLAWMKNDFRETPEQLGEIYVNITGSSTVKEQE